MQTSALDKEQMELLESITKDMLELMDDDVAYYTFLALFKLLPSDSPVNMFAKVGFMYLATERARRFVARSN